VNLRTKTVGEQPTVPLYGLGGYTPIIGRCGCTQFGGIFGQRFGKKKLASSSAALTSRMVRGHVCVANS
jgi:hypothetical protein